MNIFLETLGIINGGNAFPISLHIKTTKLSSQLDIPLSSVFTTGI